jgi:TRAP transporter TAXI family solute receptor
MPRSRTLLTLLLVGVGLVAALLIARSWRRYEQLPHIRISTGTPGGTYIILGEQLARILEVRDRIQSVEAMPSPGSVENIRRLVAGEADLALAIAPVLAGDARRGQIRVLMSLYADRLQVVVRRAVSIRSLGDLKGKRVFVGADGSGTMQIATQILSAFDILESDYTRVSRNVSSFQEATWALQGGKTDAAFFVASTPARAVADALSSGCCALLDLGRQVETIQAAVAGLEPRDIPGRTYENQPNPVRTVGASALLVGRRDLLDEVVLEIEDAVFDNIGTLAEAHIRAEDIRLGSAFELPKGVEIHPGSVTFQEREREKLLIATGTVNGKYYHVGKRIELVLRQRGIAARAIQTGGSLENVALLADRNRHALAIVQYDVALASLWSPKLYHTAQLGDSFRIPRIKGLRRIATLHEEKLHALIRRDRIHKTTRGRPTLRVLNGTRVCVGPEHSGTQVLARALLRHHGIATTESMFLSVPDMVARIHSGEIDAGFFMSHVPSEALKTVAHDGRMRLLSIDPRHVLSIDPRHVVGMLGPAVRVSTIEPGVYGAQLEDEPPVDTISTWAVLATLDDLPFDVEEITRAVSRNLRNGRGYGAGSLLATVA